MPPSHDTGGLLAVTVPEHRIDRAAREQVRRGLRPFCLAVAAYYVFLALFHASFGAAESWLQLTIACLGTAGLLTAAGVWLGRAVLPLAQVHAWVVALATAVLANISLYQVLSDEPRNFVNYALVNVLAGALILSRPALLMVLVVDAVAWMATVQLSSTGDPTFDGAFLAGTWVLAIGIGQTRRQTLKEQEALRLAAEIALDRAERRLEQRDRAIVAHRRSQEGLRKLVESSQEGVLVVQSGVVVYANRALRDRLGRGRGELMGHPLSACIHDEDQDLADPEFLRREASSSGVEVRFVDGKGDPVSLDLDAATVHFGDGPALLLIAHDPSTMDMPERQALANRMLAVGTLAAGVAHEINNPLAYTIANLEMLQIELGEGSEGDHEELVRVALEGANRVRDIVADLRTFSREDEESVVAVDVEELLDTSIRMAWNEIRHRARLVREFDGPSAVLANPSRLGQVFLNLLVNAAQAIADGDATGEEIRVRAVQDERGVVVEIRDTGVGMSPVVQEQIFQPFFTTKPVGVGTGLGLPYCREVVEECGGTLEVESEVGAGSVFRVVLPPTDQLATPTPSRVTGDLHRGPPRKVLVVDDEVALADAVAAVLRTDDVVVLRTGAEALERLDEDWDAVLCDVMMPTMSGPEFLERLLERRPELEPRFAFLTGGTFTEQTRSYLEQTRVPVLVKPFRARALRRLVDELVAAA